jgi:hypothetical protein
MSRYTIAFACVLFVLSGAASGQSQIELQSSKHISQQPQLSARKQVNGQLARVKTIISPSEVIGAFGPPMRCDSDGNLYLLTDAEPVSAVHKLNAKGERVALFDPTSYADLKVDVANYFVVAEDGSELYQLVFPHEISRYVYTYASDGTFKSAVKLQPGFPFVPGKLAVFSGGQYLISGLEYDTNRAAAMWPFTGIFAADGRLLKELELEDDETLHNMAASGDTRVASPGNPYVNHAVSNGQVQVGADGNAYLMRWTSPAIFYVISAGGEVVRRFTIDPDESRFWPFTMQLYKNRIAVLFGDTQRGGMIMKVADLEGHEIATYDVPSSKDHDQESKLSVGLACYTENPTRFVFIGTNDDRRLQLWIAEPK